MGRLLHINVNLRPKHTGAGHPKDHRRTALSLNGLICAWAFTVAQNKRRPLLPLSLSLSSRSFSLVCSLACFRVRHLLRRKRGLFSSSLAEHAVLSCLYFAKDVDRWKRNQRDRNWDQFCVSEVPRSEFLAALSVERLFPASSILFRPSLRLSSPVLCSPPVVRCRFEGSVVFVFFFLVLEGWPSGCVDTAMSGRLRSQSTSPFKSFSFLNAARNKLQIHPLTDLGKYRRNTNRPQIQPPSAKQPPICSTKTTSTR